jgi:hypothetical protein
MPRNTARKPRRPTRRRLRPARSWRQKQPSEAAAAPPGLRRIRARAPAVSPWQPLRRRCRAAPRFGVAIPDRGAGGTAPTRDGRPAGPDVVGPDVSARGVSAPGVSAANVMVLNRVDPNIGDPRLPASNVLIPTASNLAALNLAVVAPACAARMKPAPLFCLRWPRCADGSPRFVQSARAARSKDGRSDRHTASSRNILTLPRRAAPRVTLHPMRTSRPHRPQQRSRAERHGPAVSAPRVQRSANSKRGNGLAPEYCVALRSGRIDFKKQLGPPLLRRPDQSVPI